MRIASAGRIAGLPEVGGGCGRSAGGGWRGDRVVLKTPWPGTIRPIKVCESQLRIVSRTRKWPLSRGQFLLLCKISREHEVVTVRRQIPDAIGEIYVV